MDFLGFFSWFRAKNVLDGTRAILLGIGNPGTEYEGTRHNIGFDVLSEYERSLKDKYRYTDCSSDIVTGTAEGTGKVALVKPRTFVNRSGDAAAAVLRRARLGPAALMVVVDDLNLPLGRLRFRAEGSDGGHNGLRSIIGAVGNGFPRLRIGTGPLPPGVSAVDFVLGRFTREEQATAVQTAAVAAEALAFFLGNGIEQAMNRFNGQE